MLALPAAVANPINLQIREDTTLTEDLNYLTENVGLGDSVYSSLRIYGNSNVDIQSNNAYFTAHNTPDADGKGDYTAFASKFDGGYGSSIKFSGGNVHFNALSNYGAQGYVNGSLGEGEATHLIFDNTGTVEFNAVIDGNGLGRSNAIGFMGNWQKLTVSEKVQTFNVNVYGSGQFNGSALNSNGTAGLFFAGDTVSIDAKNLNINVISGQDYNVTLQTGADGTLESTVHFDIDAAKALGTNYAITYGLNNKGKTTIGENTVTTISVNDGFWNAIGISNDPMYLDESAKYSNYNLSELSILGDLSVDVTGSSVGAAAGNQYTGIELDVVRLTDTYGLYAGVTAIDGVEGYENQVSKVTLGSAGKTVRFHVANHSTGASGDVYGIYGNKADIRIDGRALDITVDSQTDGTAYGVKIENNTTLRLATENIAINVTGNNAVALSVDDTGSIRARTLNANSNGSRVIIEGQTSIGATGESSTALKIGSTGSVEMTGTTDIEAANAITAEKGSAITVTGTKENPSILSVRGTVQNQGATNLNNALYNIDGNGSTLGAVTANQSTVLLAAGQYGIDEFSGDNKTLWLNDIVDSKVNIGSKNGAMLLVGSGEANDQFANAEEAAEALAKTVVIGNQTDNEADDIALLAGDINNSLAATRNPDGSLSDVQVVKNDKLDAFGSVTALSALSLRHEMNSLSKRMGELRDAPAGTGLWVRAYGSEMEYGDQNVTMKSNSIQIGADRSIGDWRVGAAFTYTDGDTSYDLGTADTKGYGFALYGTWFVPCGAYVDLMAKYNRLDNDFGLNGMNGSYDSNAFGASVETGYRFEFLQGGLYLEPQVGLNYGRIGGETINTSNGVTIDQDSYNSLIGRAGIRAGFKFPENKGTIYARVSGLYDFDGEVNGTASKGVAHNTIEEDMGGAWIEMGIGANFNWTDNTYTYVDFERTNGGEVKENYRWNVGVRHTF